jgi:hypothetical protein
MELVSGRNLQKTFAAEYPFSQERVCRITEQVLSALTEAHAQHVIHRDLKPENIMIEQRPGEPDFVKVLDFGIAKIQEPEFADITRADMVCGTPAYMSPEQGAGGNVDARSDLYAVGVIMYQLVTGVVPFDGMNSVEILTKHQLELPIPPNVRRPERAISPDLEQLILRALEKDPTRRLQTAESFREKVLRIAERLRQERERTLEAPPVAQPTAAEKPAVEAGSPLRRSPNPSVRVRQLRDGVDPEQEEALALRARHRRWTLIGGASGVVAVLAAAGVAWAWSAKEPEAATAVSVPSHAIPPTAAPSVPTTTASAPPTPPGPAAPSPAPEVAPKVRVRPRNPAEAKRLVDEEAGPAYYEEKFREAEKFYRLAIRADSRYVAAYKGLFKAGVGAADRAAIREGGRGYLKLNPEADDAEVIRETLRRF